ncbi:acetyltransferase (GNAT) family protein [Hasllibacter halocynthiae]|uniref:Acetyltransferase (GNAT) family protein n=1 Tax=Hasllibacter halocynthiae TaxID=595589 RepID=A0A2T0X782_9RHOB|nr:GNAT family N-acetyltransferase [Hasllibacter halocynthiae]PRY94734.1 acetyltransferase (GNAT) family protein [Hasllibacter halocynthiae]
MDKACELRGVAPGDIGWAVMEHGRLYARDEGYGPAFEALVARVAANFLEAGDPLSRGWIAWSGDRRVGCVFCMDDGAGWSRLRMFLVLPEARGTGLADRLFDALVDWSAAKGQRGLRLRTHESHRAAGRLYARKGMRLTAAEPVTAFGQATVEQLWEGNLAALAARRRGR